MESLFLATNSKSDLEILQTVARKNPYICSANVQIHG